MRGKLSIFIIIVLSFIIGINNVNALTNVNLKGKYYYSEAKKELELVNKERAKYGLKPLVMDKDLFESANKRASEIVIFMDETHHRPNGKSYSTISSKVKGENTGYIYGYSNVSESITNSWMNSPSHRANILDKDYETIGIGCFKYNDTYYFVQEFGYGDINKLNKYPKDSTKEVTIEKLDNTIEVKFTKIVYNINNVGYVDYNTSIISEGTKYTIFKSNNNIKIVEENNRIKIYALKSGITQIMIKYTNGEYATAFIVTGNNVNNYYKNEKYVKVCGTTMKVNADITPEKTLDKYNNYIYSGNKLYSLSKKDNSFSIYSNNMNFNELLYSIFNTKFDIVNKIIL